MTTTLFDPHSTYGRHRIRTWFSPLLPNSHHRVKIELVDARVDKAASSRSLIPPSWIQKHSKVTIFM
jgi:hypothetical protein